MTIPHLSELLFLPEEHDDTWPEEVKEMWTERALMRLVFDKELDEMFDKRYKTWVLGLSCTGCRSAE